MLEIPEMKVDTTCSIEVSDGGLKENVNYHVNKGFCSGKIIKLTDVIFGDVWFCGGQSNMEMAMENITKGLEEVEKSAQYNIRFTVMANVADPVS